MNRKTTTAIAVALLALAVWSPMAIASQHEDGDTNETQGDGMGADGSARFSYEDGVAEGRFISFAYDEPTGTLCSYTFEESLIFDEIAWDDFSADVKAEGSAFIARDGGAAFDDEDDGAHGNETGDDAEGNETGDDPEGNETGDGTEGNETDDDGNQTDGDATAAPCPLDDATDDGNETGDGTDGDQTDDGNETDDGNQTDGNGTQSGEDDRAGGESALKVHDAPNGFIKTELRGAETVTWTVAEGLGVQQVDDWRVRITGSGVDAVLWKDHDSKESGFEVAENEITLTSKDKANVKFRIATADFEGDASVSEAASDGRVATEVLIVDEETALVSDFQDADVQVATRPDQITIDIDITVILEDGFGDQPEDDPEGEQPEDGNETGDQNQTQDGDGTGDQNQTQDGNGTADGDTTTRSAQTVVVVGIDQSVLADIDVQQIVVLLGDQEIQIIEDMEDVLVIEEDEPAEAVIATTQSGEMKLVAAVPTGEQVLALQSQEQFQVQERDDLVADDEDDRFGASADQDGVEQNDTDVNEPDIAVPGLGLAALVALLAAAATIVARRRR